MPNEPVVPTPDPAVNTDPDPAPKPSETDTKAELATILARPDVQEIINQGKREALDKAERKAQEREKAAREKAIKEAEEKRLLEANNFKELADLKSKEAEEATTRLKQYEHQAKVNALLDKKGVTDPEVRAIWLRFDGDLTELDPAIDKFTAQIEIQVEKRVNERLKTPPPPPKGEVKVKEDTSLDAQIAAAVKAGDYKESLRLKQIKSNQLNQTMRKAPVSIAEVVMPPMPGQP